MTLEDQHTDRKSLRTVSGKSVDWDALAKDCVCFANGTGGRLIYVGERRWRRYRLSEREHTGA